MTDTDGIDLHASDRITVLPASARSVRDGVIVQASAMRGDLLRLGAVR